MASCLGAEAVNLLVKGEYGKAAGIIDGEINVVSFDEALKKKELKGEKFIKLIKILT